MVVPDVGRYVEDYAGVQTSTLFELDYGVVSSAIGNVIARRSMDGLITELLSPFGDSGSSWPGYTVDTKAVIDKAIYFRLYFLFNSLKIDDLSNSRELK